MEKVQWKVDGMDCNTCAINIHKYLEKQGMKNIKVNYATGDVLFDVDTETGTDKLKKGITDLGYTVVGSKSRFSRPHLPVKGEYPFISGHLPETHGNIIYILKCICPFHFAKIRSLRVHLTNIIKPLQHCCNSIPLFKTGR